MIALSMSDELLIFHIVNGAILSVPFILAAVCIYLAVQDDLRSGVAEVGSIVRDMPRKTVDTGVALGVLDPVNVELRRITREHKGALRDIARLHAQAKGEMNRLSGVGRRRRTLGRGPR
jgi:predicted short-subunit dehydrogenase-like oxidoreductase (DUF2520 family)